MTDCIAIEASRLGIISQYTLVYCDARNKRQGWAVSQYNPAKPATRPGTVPATRHKSWVWARRARAGCAGGRHGCATECGARARAWVRQAGARDQAQTRLGQGWLGGRRAAWGLGARAGQDCALDLVFNPVFRLGIFS